MMSPEAHRMMDAFLFHVRLKDWPVNSPPLLTVPHPHAVLIFLFRPGEGTPIVFPTCYSLNFWLLSCGTYTGPSWTLMRLHTSLIVPANSSGLCMGGRGAGMGSGSAAGNRLQKADYLRGHPRSPEIPRAVGHKTRQVSLY